MNERQLGSLQIENDVITITERDPKTPLDHLPVWVSAGLAGYPESWQTSVTISEWIATVGEGEIVAYGVMMAETMTDENVWAHVVVAPENRGAGLGSLMIRITTDLAIFHRRRKIATRIHAGREVLIELLESEDFEFKPPVMPGFVEMEKTLKWQ